MSTGSKWTSMPLGSNWGNTGGHAVFYGSLLMHDDETKIV